MSIIVVCKNCLQRFKVSDKFAGKQGPCPKCKTVIRVPRKDEEVKVHSAEETRKGPRGKSGDLVLEPIARESTELSMWVWGAIGGCVLLAFGVALFGRSMETESQMLLAGIGVILLAPPLVIGGYWFLKNDELEPYRGWGLWLRTGICCAIYILCWAAYGYWVPAEWKDELWKWTFLGPLFAVVGAVTAFACYDLELSSGFFHFAFYAGVIALLGILMGVPVMGG